MRSRFAQILLCPFECCIRYLATWNRIGIRGEIWICRRAWWKVLSFCLGLCKEEVIKVEIAGFLSYFAAGKDHSEHPHVMVPLLGRLKGETREIWHLLPIVWKTRSGIKVGVWAS